MQKRVNISIDENLNERWNEVAEKHGLVKSRMIENFLNQVLPVLENKQPYSAMQNAMFEVSRGYQNTCSLFDMEHDESIEEYKAMKRA